MDSWIFHASHACEKSISTGIPVDINSMGERSDFQDARNHVAGEEDKRRMQAQYSTDSTRYLGNRMKNNHACSTVTIAARGWRVTAGRRRVTSWPSETPFLPRHYITYQSGPRIIAFAYYVPWNSLGEILWWPPLQQHFRPHSVLGKPSTDDNI